MPILGKNRRKLKTVKKTMFYEGYTVFSPPSVRKVLLKKPYVEVCNVSWATQFTFLLFCIVQNFF